MANESSGYALDVAGREEDTRVPGALATTTEEESEG